MEESISELEFDDTLPAPCPVPAREDALTLRQIRIALDIEETLAMLDANVRG